MKTGSLFFLLLFLITTPVFSAKKDVKKQEAPKETRPLRVGVYKGGRSLGIEPVLRTLQANGITARAFDRNEFQKIFLFDAIIFLDGYHEWGWADLTMRMAITEYVEARGGGVVFSMFCTGSAGRSIVRPMFPDTGYSVHKVNGPAIHVTDPKNPLAEGLPPDFLTPCWDHAAITPGRRSKTVAVDSNDDPVLVCGQSGRGKVVMIGPWLGLDFHFKPVYPMKNTDRIMLLNSVRWAARDPAKPDKRKPEISKGTKLKVLRADKMVDWFHNERGKNWFAGILVAAHDRVETRLDNMAFRINHLESHSGDKKIKASIISARQGITGLRQLLKTNYEQACKDKRAEIAKMTIEQLTAEPVCDFHGMTRGKARQFRQQQIEKQSAALVSPTQLDAAAKLVESLERKLAAEIRKSETEALTIKAQQDAKQVPSLIMSLKSENPDERAVAVLELGRIADTRSIKPLVNSLTDPEYRVRRNAIQALGWMQATAALDPLMQLTVPKNDARTRRRAAQALGQIGDNRASKTLLALLNDDDLFVRQNAVLSLGWIGEKKAVRPLLEIVKAHAGNRNSALQDRETALCAIRSLGHMGDKAALPILQPLADKFKDSKPEGMFNPISAYRAACLAINEIRKGGRIEKGIKQPACLQDPSEFYWLANRYNAFFGRYATWGCTPVKDAGTIASLAEEGGGTGLIEFSTVDQIHYDIPTYEEALPWISQIGLKVVTGMRAFGHTLFDKAGMEKDLLTWGREKCFGGFWGEESLEFEKYFARNMKENTRLFREYLKNKYSARQLSDIGIPNPNTATCPPLKRDREEYRSDPVKSALLAEYTEYIAKRGVEMWQEAEEWMFGLRKGTYLMFSLSQRYTKGGSTYIRAYPEICSIIGAAGPQDYCSHSPENNFHLDMVCDGESRPALGEFYQMDADTPDRVERGFASSFLHGQCFFVWWWGHISKHFNDNNAGGVVWDAGRWDAAVRQFNKGKAISQYLAPAHTSSPKLVTQLYSGRTTTLPCGGGSLDGAGGKGGRKYRYTQNQQAIWESLIQSHIPVDMTWLETQSADKLSQYSVAILSDARSIAGKEAETIRNWVRNGGTLIATGGSTRHDEWNRPMENYALADVFGVQFEHMAMNSSPTEANSYIELNLKPRDGIQLIQVTDRNYLKHMEGRETAECMPLTGYDIVKLTTGKMVARWPDRKPAVIENSFGKGTCIFLTPMWPGLSHTTRRWTVHELYKDFWPGSRELIAACVRRGLELTGTPLPVEVKNCDKRVEMALKIQQDRNRWMIHLLNIDPKLKQLKNIEVSVRIPENMQLKEACYVYPDRQPIKPKQKDSLLSFVIRPFDVHEMAVLQWEEVKPEKEKPKAK